MKKIKITGFLFFFAVFCTVSGCGPMDGYKDIAGDNELSYPAKINIVALPGKERVLILGANISDPKVVKCRIYWDLNEKFLDVPIENLTHYDEDIKLVAELPLSEKSYSFTVYTYDSEGNHSVPTSATGRSYGGKYAANITNRIVKSFALASGTPRIVWYPLDPTMGAVKTVVRYKVTGDSAMKTVEVLPSEETTELDSAYDQATEVEYYTVYLPEPLSVDTFDTEPGKMKL